MSMPLTKAAGRFSETVIDNEVVVMSLDTGDFFSLTGTARDIWDLIDGTRDAEEIVTTLAERYAMPRQSIAAELRAFVDQLTSAGLLAGS